MKRLFRPRVGTLHKIFTQNLLVNLKNGMLRLLKNYEKLKSSINLIFLWTISNGPPDFIKKVPIISKNLYKNSEILFRFQFKFTPLLKFEQLAQQNKQSTTGVGRNVVLKTSGIGCGVGSANKLASDFLKEKEKQNWVKNTLSNTTAQDSRKLYQMSLENNKDDPT